MDVVTEDQCPVCQGTVQNPSQPSSCCRKVFCQSCLTESINLRHHCPYCRTPVRTSGPHETARLGQTRFFHPLLGLVDSNASSVGNNIQDRQFLLPQPNRVYWPRDGQVTRTTALPLQRRLLQRPNPTRAQTFLNRVTTAAPPPAPAVYPIITAQATPAPPPAPPTRAANLFQAPPALQVAPRLAPPFQRVNFSPLILPDSSSDLMDELFFPTLISLMENSQAQPSGSTLRTYKCPYCQQDGLDDLELRDHCNANHINDTRQVVCPVCVSLPHGDPLYHSRDFIGHLNLRHCYYIDDITNVHQSDEVNLQAAILMSLSNNS